MLNLPKAILFDWDGTVIDSMGKVQACMQQASDFMGLPPITAEHAIEAAIHGSKAGKVIYNLDDKANHQYWQLFSERYFKFTGDCTLTKGVGELIAALPTSIPLGVVTNMRRDLFDDQLAHLGWRDGFTASVCVDEAPRNKPAPDPALMALEIMRIKPSREVWFIGDTRGDIECANAAGLTSILLASGQPTCNPHYAFAHCGEIHAQLSGILQIA